MLKKKKLVDCSDSKRERERERELPTVTGGDWWGDWEPVEPRAAKGESKRERERELRVRVRKERVYI